MKILVINGANLNLLHKRNSRHYGTLSLQDIEKKLRKEFPEIEFEFFQSNSEGALIDKVQAADTFDGLIINAGAYSHYSIALRDALDMLSIPKVEVHLSNIYAREDFRRKSVLSEVCDGVIAGFHSEVYSLAVQAIIRR